MTIPHLHSVAPAAEPIDLARAKAAARDLLVALGCDLDDESVRETPRRLAETYVELLTPRPSTRRRSRTTRATTSSLSRATSRSTPSASTICCRSTAWRTSPTC